MTPLDRQLDRVRDVPVSASVAPVPPPAGGSAHQVAPAPHDNGTHSGAATSGCICGHSPVSHRRYRECTADGCVCWAYRKTTNNRNAPAAAGTGSGA